MIAIQNARLFNETKEALERQTATAEILKVIAQSPGDVQPVLDAIVASAKRLVDAYSATVWRVERDSACGSAAFTRTDEQATEILQRFERGADGRWPVRAGPPADRTADPDG